MGRRWALVAAGVWSAGLLVAAVVAPTYRSTSSAGSAGSASAAGGAGAAPGGSPATLVLHSATDTLVAVNGFKILLPMALPLLLVVVVALLLRAHHRYAWAVTALVLPFCLLGMLTVGIFVLPVAVLLVVACSQAEAVP